MINNYLIPVTIHTNHTSHQAKKGQRACCVVTTINTASLTVPTIAASPHPRCDPRITMKTCLVLLALVSCPLWAASTAFAFVVHPHTGRIALPPLRMLDRELFDEDEEMMPIVDHYLRTKYRQTAQVAGQGKCNEQDLRRMLKTILPPVSAAELDDEVNKTIKIVLESDPSSTKDAINEDCFVNAISKNSYWQQAGGLVVKELMFLDALYSYYQTGQSLLDNDDYETLKDNLTWEGSSVATMKANEALFVTAVASAQRGEPIMDDDAYATLKSSLKQQDSWVTARGQDALEKLGLSTFLGYLHRAL